MLTASVKANQWLKLEELCSYNLIDYHLQVFISSCMLWDVEEDLNRWTQQQTRLKFMQGEEYGTSRFTYNIRRPMNKLRSAQVSIEKYGRWSILNFWDLGFLLLLLERLMVRGKKVDRKYHWFKSLRIAAPICL